MIHDLTTAAAHAHREDLRNEACLERQAARALPCKDGVLRRVLRRRP